MIIILQVAYNGFWKYIPLGIDLLLCYMIMLRALLKNKNKIKQHRCIL